MIRSHYDVVLDIHLGVGSCPSHLKKAEMYSSHMELT